MNFSDIFKSSFIEKMASVTVLDMVIAILLAFCIGLFICYVYKKTYNGVMYSAGFSVTLLAMTMITTIIILAVTSNVVLSLGMVGALSIVRFRTAIKEPLDIAFLFWAIGSGIILAAGMLPLAVLGSLGVGMTLMLFANKKTYTNPYIVVIQCDGQQTENRVKTYLMEKTNKCVVKSKVAKKETVELNFEVRLKEENTDFINELSDFNGVSSAVLVSYNGDYMS